MTDGRGSDAGRTAALLRRRLRAARRALTAEQRDGMSRALCARVAALPVFRHSHHIAAFLPFDGEPDPAALWRDHPDKTFYLPVLRDRRLDPPMLFARYAAGDTLITNRFGILEPDPDSPRRAAERLDLVLTPLVGFDQSGARLGVGGGYYDRSFAFIRDRDRAAQRRPFLLGFALEVQKVDCLQRQPWDLPLDAIASDATLYSPA